MKFFTKLAIATALTSLSLAASAMTPIADTELSQVSGQDGVSIAANLNVNIGSFTYTNTSTGGGSVSFNNIDVTGLFGATIDVISGAAFTTATGGITAEFGTGYYNGKSDVVAIAIPVLTNGSAKTDLGQSVDAAITIKVGSITMGGNGTTAPSFGSMAINNLNLQGTTAFIWAH